MATDDDQPVWSVGDNGDVAENAVTAACDAWPIQRASDSAAPDWYDAEFAVSHSAPALGLVAPPGTPVEVKSCRVTYGDRRGRWWLRRQNHEQLVAVGGLYALGVYDGTDGQVLDLTLLPASIVDTIVNGNWWDAGEGGKTAEEFVQVPWSAIFTVGEGGDRVA